jgi:hypothetical protein
MSNRAATAILTARTSIAPVVALSACLAACGDGSDPGTPSARQAAVLTATPRVSDAGDPALGRPSAVPAKANIFGAGRHKPPAPGGGGAGVAPPCWSLPMGSNRIVRVTRATGRVTPIVDYNHQNEASGDHIGLTDVYSYRGISGIKNEGNGMFLVGVFLTDRLPTGKAPRRLDFTRRERFDSLAPRIGQTFFVGDGAKRSFRVPSRATRLCLGFADAYQYQGRPGWYGNNAGELAVTVEVDDRA